MTDLGRRDPGFLVVADYTVSTGNRDSVLGLVAQLAAHTRQEPGNLRYSPLIDPTDPSHIVIVEQYRTAEDFDTHKASAHFVTLAVGQIIPLLISRTVSTFHVRGD